MYSIPSEEEVVKAVKRVFASRARVETQALLARLILKILGKKEYRLSGERAKRIVLDNDLATLDVEYKELTRTGTPRKCPVCGNKVKPLKNKTIFNGTVTLGFEWVECGYWSGLHRRIPSLYVFKRK